MRPRVAGVALLCGLLGLGGCAPAAAGGEQRFVGQLGLPGGPTVVVAEGDFEARSIGSYSLRLYRPAPAHGDETTFFVHGLVRARDGGVEGLAWADLGEPPAPALVVTMRSAGSGSYLSADAFAVEPERVRLLACVTGLPPGADAVQALRRSLREAQPGAVSCGP